jgi:nitroreductase
MTSPGIAGGAPRQRAGPPGQDTWLADAIGGPLRELLRLAARAPSGHNAQPWRVLVRSRARWSIAIAPDRRLPAVDPADREAVIGIGAFLESLCLAGMALGYRVEPERYGERVDDPELVALRLEPRPRRGGTEVLSRRSTVRHDFEHKPLKPGDITRLCDGLGPVAWLPAGSAAARAVGEIVVGATRAQASRDEAQAELANWIRWTERAATTRPCGLTPAGLEFRGLSAWLARHVFDEGTVMSSRFRRSMVDRAAQLAGACGGWLVVASPGSSMASLLDAGRRTERLYLRARELGIGMQPMSQPLEEAGWRQALERATGIDGFPRMLLRVGYNARWPDSASPRLAPEAFTHLLS